MDKHKKKCLLPIIGLVILFFGTAVFSAKAAVHHSHKHRTAKYKRVNSVKVRKVMEINSNGRDSNNVNNSININFNNGAFASRVENIIKKYGYDANVGVYVQSLNNGNVIYQRNALQLFMPASSLKVFTAAAALSYLGADYTFKTRVFTAPRSINSQGTLNGDLYFYFDGDPTLTREHLNALIGALAKLGTHSIHGNIYLDDYVFDRSEFGPGWMWDERNFCYAAPVSAINIDHNCFPFSVSAAKTIGAPLLIKRYDGYNFIEFINNAITSNSSYIDCPFTLHGTENNTYVLKGCMHAKSGPWNFSVAVRSMRPYASAVIAQLLEQNNIRLNGEIRFARVPTSKQLVLIAEHDSAPLSKLIKVMLKKSDNLIADAVYKKLGQSRLGIGNWVNGGKAVAGILAGNTHINFSRVKIIDGCGLSRHNLLSPVSLVALLNYAYRDNAMRDAFVLSLPISGIDGHLQFRMRSLTGKVRAKTGTMSGITALAGYIYTRNNQILSFAIMVNNFVGSVRKYQRLEDEICTLLAMG